jgi:hypothetical protein
MEAANLYEVQRDAGKHQMDEQQWRVKATEGKVVFMSFQAKAFRKHFIIQSKKGTPTMTKATNKATKRFKTTIEARKGGLITSGPQKTLKKRYGDGGPSTEAIDLTSLDLDTVLTEMAQKLVAEDFGSAATKDVVFTFSKPCVLHSDMAINDTNNGVKVTHAPLKQSIKFQVSRGEGGASFNVGHVTT